ncbi:MAG: C40 family peptidase [Paracoccaceae bacterium]
MSDRRVLKSNGRVAHESLRGQVEADQFVDGTPCQVIIPVADLCRDPRGARDRQLVRGEVFVTLDREGDWFFGFAERDGYVGWIAVNSLSARVSQTTHVVSVPRSYAKSTPGLKAMGSTIPLSFGTGLNVVGEAEGWAAVEWANGLYRETMFVPPQHLSLASVAEVDLVGVAERFLGTPYLWGGNSSFGIDCSGLVQAAYLACGVPCPGDSDQQGAQLGEPFAQDDPAERGDLYFWKGHVALAVDAETLIHASAHHMAVAYEPIKEAIARIEQQGDGPVTSRRRHQSALH